MIRRRNTIKNTIKHNKKHNKTEYVESGGDDVKMFGRELDLLAVW